MNTGLSPLGWVLIVILAVFIIGINISLIASLRKKNSANDWLNRIQDAGIKIKDPFQEENIKLAKLDQLINQLDNPKIISDHNPLTGKQNEE